MKYIEYLHSRFNSYLHLSDPIPLWLTLASYVGTVLPGKPVWLMLIGPPSCGGSTVLGTIARLPGVVSVGDISVAGLLSAAGKKERAKTARGGVLMELVDRGDGTRWGVLNGKDFTSVLLLDKAAKNLVLSALKEIADGEWDRNKGVDGGMHLRWEGKAGYVTKCTADMIDRHREDMGKMGDRFVYLRFFDSDGDGESMKALSVDDPERAMKLMRGLVEEYLNDLFPAGWLDAVGTERMNALLDNDTKAQKARKVSHSHLLRLTNMAMLAARGRGVVRRDWQRREIQGVEWESPVRIASQFRQLFQAMRYMGVELEDVWRAVERMVWSAFPKARWAVTETLLTAQGEALTVRELMKEMVVRHGPQGEESYIRGVVEECQRLGLVERVGKGEKGGKGERVERVEGGAGTGRGTNPVRVVEDEKARYRITDWVGERMKERVGERRGDE